MATSRTPSRSKPAAKANSIGLVVDRLLAVQRARLVPRSIEVAATAKRMPRASQVRTLDTDLIGLRREIERVQAISERLAEVPAQRQGGSVL